MYVDINNKQVFVHQLICRAFHGPPPTEKHTSVHHKDKIRDHNNVENLEWSTATDQALDKTETVDKIQSKDRKGHKTVYNSMTEAAAAIGKSRWYVSNMCKTPNDYKDGLKWKRIPRS